MTSDGKSYAPFPRLLGEGTRLSSREDVLGGNDQPPGYLMVTLRALRSGKKPRDAPPSQWLAEFDSVADSRDALRDIAQDFRVQSSSYGDGTVARWWIAKTNERISEPEALQLIWSGYAQRLLDELKALKMSVSAYIDQLNDGWAAYRADRAPREKARAEALQKAEELALEDFRTQVVWPAASCVYWMYRREAVQFDTPSMIVAELTNGFASLEQAADLFVENARDALWQECRAGRVKIFGRCMGKGALTQIPLIELQVDGARFSEDLDAHPLIRTETDLYWSSVHFDRADLWSSFPPRNPDGSIPPSQHQRLNENLEIVQRAEDGGVAEFRELMKLAKDWVSNQPPPPHEMVWTHLAQHLSDSTGRAIGPRRRKDTWARLQAQLKQKYPDRWRQFGRPRANSSAYNPPGKIGRGEY